MRALAYPCPITGDNYFAMKHGTVPSKLYNMANNSQMGIGFYRFDNFLIAEREPEEGYLFDSDIESLEHGFKEYAGLAFDEVEKKNHEESAWKKNFMPNTSAFMPFEDIIEVDWVKEDLDGVAHRMVL